MDEQVEIVGRAFVQHYYRLFDTERASLTGLYQPSSILTFEGHRFLGTEEISNKLIGLPFEACQHAITTIDCQPSSINGGVIVFVSGRLQLAGEEHQLKFSQMFHLAPTAEGSFYVQNDIFRLNYG